MPQIPNIGEPNPNDLFTAIGQALSQWELLELELAVLHTIFQGNPGLIEAVQDYGRRNPTLAYRLVALEKAGAIFFQNKCDQDLEGDFYSLIRDVKTAAIERHRIAHGLVTPIAIVDPSDADDEGRIIIGQRYHYFLGAPWYSASRLNMSFAEMNAAMIYDRREIFFTLYERAVQLSQRLAPDN